MASGILTLGDDDVDIGGDGQFDLVGGLHLADQERSTGVNRLRVRSWVTEGELDRRRVCVESEAHGVRALVERERDEADTDSRVARSGELGGQPVRIGVSASDETEAAGSGDRCRQSAAGGVSHRCQDDRIPDTEQRRERCRYVD